MDYRIEYSIACNECLKKPGCSIQGNDMAVLAEEMLGSPVYFGSVTGRLMERTRWLYGKLGTTLTHTTLQNGSQELTQMILERFPLFHGFRLIMPP